MIAILKKTWELIDGASNGRAKVQAGPGEVELERIPNPYGHQADWLVLKGTRIGMAEGAWRQWQNGNIVDNPDHPDHGKPTDWGEWEIIIKE